MKHFNNKLVREIKKEKVREVDVYLVSIIGRSDIGNFDRTELTILSEDFNDFIYLFLTYIKYHGRIKEGLVKSYLNWFIPDSYYNDLISQCWDIVDWVRVQYVDKAGKLFNIDLPKSLITDDFEETMKKLDSDLRAKAGSEKRLEDGHFKLLQAWDLELAKEVLKSSKVWNVPEIDSLQWVNKDIQFSLLEKSSDTIKLKNQLIKLVNSHDGNGQVYSGFKKESLESVKAVLNESNLKQSLKDHVYNILENFMFSEGISWTSSKIDEVFENYIKNSGYDISGPRGYSGLCIGEWVSLERDPQSYVGEPENVIKFNNKTYIINESD